MGPAELRRPKYAAAPLLEFSQHGEGFREFLIGRLRFVHVKARSVLLQAFSAVHIQAYYAEHTSLLCCTYTSLLCLSFCYIIG